ncbi:hypothetical protein D5S18_00325 [Nocardia panacis]|uniref:Uncharacterized protein n=1 Tax=Nocardia panacis TaxID=2340916 RepID=A0A3A4KUJ0_9NOCA|nr:hypothetical protein [Nocardia panacis]RJO80234.1 hypothetical protein D5S18_00325 [Nocardia panacis]
MNARPDNNDIPDRIMILGEDGAPKSVVDVARMQADATRLMYQMAAAASDNAELDRIGTEWAAALDPDYFGYVAAGALSLLVRNILAPLLEVLDATAPGHDFRRTLAESRDHAEATLGGGGQ